MSTKKSTEDFAKELLEKQNLTLIGEYNGARNKCSFLCVNGHVNTGTPTNILRRGYNCKECLHGRSIVPKIIWDDSKIVQLIKLIEQDTTLEDLAVYFNTTTAAILNVCDKYSISRSKVPASFKSLQEVLKKQNRVLLTKEQEYVGSKTFLDIQCSKGHVVSQYAGNVHYKNTGCPSCTFIDGKSTTENTLVEYIKSIYSGWVELGDRTILNGKELDILLPDLGLAIEYNGEYWHSDVHVPKDYHINKTNMVNDFGFQLIHVPEHLWVNKQEIIKAKLNNLINPIKNKLYARNCKVVKLSYFPKEFLNHNHLQGSGAPTGINYALQYKNEIVAVMTFSKPRFTNNIEYELVRFCSLLDYQIVGGASKLLKAFEREYTPNSLISYANLMWSKGNVYNKLGFTYSHDSVPGYYYAKQLNIVSRYQAQKHKLEALLKVFDPKLTESENMSINGYNRVWDCGNQVWIKHYPPEAY